MHHAQQVPAARVERTDIPTSEPDPIVELSRSLDLAELVDRALMQAGPTLFARRQALRLSWGPALPLVEAAPLSLERIVVSSLQDLAARAAENSRILVSAWRDSEHVVLRIASLPPEPTTITNGRDVLFRLPIRQHPLSTPVNLRPLPTCSNPPPARVQRRVLLVDDNDDATLMLGDLLTTVGHVVEIAHDGREALRKAALFTPEVAFLDIGLPDINGYDLAMKLHALPHLGRCRLIALSGSAHVDEHQRVMHAGFERQLRKPADPRTLVALIDKP